MLEHHQDPPTKYPNQHHLRETTTTPLGLGEYYKCLGGNTQAKWVLPFSLMLIMRYLAWNCQGAAYHGFMRLVKILISKERLNFLCLMETKVSGDQANDICKWMRFDDCLRVEAFGFSGGIWTFWINTMKVDIIIATHPQFVLLRVCEQGTNPWYVSFLYGSQTNHMRKQTLDGSECEKA